MPPGAEADVVELQALLRMLIVEDCAIVFALSQSPARGVLGILDEDLFGGGCVVVQRLVPVPFVGVVDVLSDGRREGEGEGAGVDATVQVTKIDQLIVDRAL